ncbi:MAG: hypothetical protein QM504_06770 [Pseudomonadota bacterium]
MVGKQNVLIGIRLTLPKRFQSTGDVAAYIQEYYFDTLVSGGFFRLLPEEHKSLASIEYLDLTVDIAPSIFEKSVKSEGGVEKELDCTADELDAFVSAKYAMNWQQFSLHKEV